MRNEIIKRINDWHSGKEVGPYKAQLHLSHLCNLNCMFCEVHSLAKLDEMSTEEFISLIRQGNDLGIEEWHICGGGEPLFFKDKALDVMKEIKKSKKIGELVTNGTLLDEASIRDIVNMGWNNVTISIDSPAEKTYNELRGKDAFMKVKENIKLLNYHKRLSKSKLPRLTINFVICSKNLYQIPDMVRFAKQNDIDYLQLLEMNVWDEEMRHLEIAPSQKDKAINELKKAYILSVKLDQKTNIKSILDNNLLDKANNMIEALTSTVQTSSFSNVKNSACYYPWYVISICPDGRVLPCFNIFKSDENIREKSLEEIWYGEYFFALREKVMKNELHRDCDKCFPQDFVVTKEIRKALERSI